METRRSFNKRLALLSGLALAAGCTDSAAGNRRTPVIFDTDIGDDIDDPPDFRQRGALRRSPFLLRRRFPVTCVTSP